MISACAGYGVAAASDASDPRLADWSLAAAPAQLPATGRVLYGETVYADDDGTTKTSTWQHGQVTKVSESAVTVRSADGTEWTWTLTWDTTITKNDQTVSVFDIATGDTVRVSGHRDGDTRTASAIADPPPDRAKKLQERLQNLPDRAQQRLENLPDVPRPR